jgi:CheY-like chemotaxis protein
MGENSMINVVAPQPPLVDQQKSLTAESPSQDAAAMLPKVLVVDDFLLERRMLSRLIQKVGGLEMIEAKDGREALDAIEREAPAVVLTDLQMPGMNGLELVTAVRATYPHIPVILMTAYGSEEVAIQALRAGATNYVPKKSLDAELAHTLKKVLALATAERHRQRVNRCLKGRDARFRLENDSELIAPLIDLLQGDLAAMNICDSTARMQVGVALQEALANALYHGNLEVSSDLRQDDERLFYSLAKERRGLTPFRDRRIEVHAQVDSQGATIVVKDEGPGFDTSSLNREINPEDLMRIGGRGLLLIRAFMDEVRHNETGNRITMIKRSRDETLLANGKSTLYS